jgi:hypothetical protein
LKLEPVLHSRISPPPPKKLIQKCLKKLNIFNNYIEAEQISLAVNECKNMISLLTFFASGGEITEWKTGFTSQKS